SDNVRKFLQTSSLVPLRLMEDDHFQQRTYCQGDLAARTRENSSLHCVSDPGEHMVWAFAVQPADLEMPLPIRYCRPWSAVRSPPVKSSSGLRIVLPRDWRCYAAAERLQ